MDSDQLKRVLVQWAPVFRIIILTLICLMAFLIRIFSVIRFEAVIHEFDPWFNYRTTKFLTEQGFYEFWNWFDADSWFPLGRVTGGTLYPGLMTTSAIIYKIAHALSFPLDIRHVCVFLAPVFSALTALACYLVTREASGKPEAGMISALMIAIVPSYISRSVAGSYDNEGVAIFALLLTFYLFLRAMNTVFYIQGSLLWSCSAALSFFYMVAAWGGYAFIINIIPIFIIGSIIIGKYDHNMYIAYNSFYVIGTILSMQIPFVGFQAVTSNEHLASHIVFVFLQVYEFSGWLKERIGTQKFRSLSQYLILSATGLLVAYSLFMTLTGRMQWSGRSLSLLDPTYAKKFIPIIASVSEHQPTTWTSFFFDAHYLTVLAPLGFYYSITKDTPGRLFMVLFTVLSVYFAGVMVRLLLILCPALCVMAGIGISDTIELFSKHIMNIKEWWDYTNDSSDEEEEEEKKEGDAQEDRRGPRRQRQRRKRPKYGYPLELAISVIALCGIILVVYICHCTWVAAEAYSSPTIIMATKGQDGSKRIVDDYREAYYWLRMNTEPNSRIMAWWDYGYQITGMSNRTVLVDNNTWNNTHIATVGMIFASNEKEAAIHMRKLDVDYALVIFGGVAYYSGDDINKFLWIIRIASGVYPNIKEDDFLSRGSYKIDSSATPTLRESLMYKLCYYRFSEMQTSYQRPPGYDLVRNAEVGEKNIKLTEFTEVYTTRNWMVRIFKLHKDSNRGGTYLRPRSTYMPRNQDTLLKYELTYKKAPDPNLIEEVKPETSELEDIDRFLAEEQQRLLS